MGGMPPQWHFVQDPLCGAQTKAERIFSSYSAHISCLGKRETHKRRHFLLPFMGHVKGVWNLSIAFSRDVLLLCSELEWSFLSMLSDEIDAKSVAFGHFHAKDIFKKG
jgi:hypothetical protein